MREAVARAVRLLTPHIGADAAAYVRWLAAEASRRANPRAELERMAERVAHNEPLAYVLGTQPFGPLELLARPPVLIPRPETEQWAMRAVKHIVDASTHERVHVLDMCTGSGCIALLAAHELARSSHPWRVTAVDIDPSAISLTLDNARKLGMTIHDGDGYQYAKHGAGEVRIAAADLFNDADMERPAVEPAVHRGRRARCARRVRARL
ncbi:hypothetical protein MCUN1_003462 [Malassezia cuniculi]|uniref:Uncharacterized protein n=1 Tax=Malassezia cuniculi TaxID=948313 RepID=A0AAF0EWT3_9BASI|nr:hypothetical protein MCUN1_003462 [Malassezia cuniculi]